MARLPISAEDNFALIDMSGPPDDVLPDDEQMEFVAWTTQALARHWRFLWDFRNLGTGVYRDTIDGFAGIWDASPEGAPPPTMLVPPGRVDEVVAAFAPREISAVEMLPKDLASTDLDLRPFELLADTRGGADRLIAALVSQGVGWEDALRALAGPRPWTPYLQDLAQDRRRADEAPRDPLEAGRDIEREYALDTALRSAIHHSVLTQLALQEHGGTIHVIPYHGTSLHHVEVGDGSAVLVRPARVNRRYWATFGDALRRLEELINAPGVSEREIEEHLKRNPFLLRSLGYTDIYHQVVLPREGAADLRPDVIAEPVDSQWAEIIDLKLPGEKLVVGRENRVAQAAALMSAAAQLREYGAYFDDRAASARIEAELGIRCYKPRLTVIIGRDPTRFTKDERRRALTAYPDLRVVTYDQLLRAARDRLLL